MQVLLSLEVAFYLFEFVDVGKEVIAFPVIEACCSAHLRAVLIRRGEGRFRAVCPLQKSSLTLSLIFQFVFYLVYYCLRDL